MSQNREQTRRRRYYDKHAASYDGWMRYYDRVMLGDRRAQLCSQSVGRTLELAVGTGLNLPLYPQDIQLTGIDSSPALLAIAEHRALALGISADLHVGDADALDFPDNHFDSVISTLALSTIPDARRVAAEAWRVLRPNGLLLLLDHVRSPFTPVRWIQRSSIRFS
jgi:ubiquinone/menaquinone biosynthesis C-methylase UbiE